MTKRYLIHREDLDDSAWKDLVKTSFVGKDIQWKDKKLTLEFEGNRVDVLIGAGEGTAKITVDGKKPSDFPGAYRNTRPQPGPWSPLTVTRIDSEQPLQL